jgi:hypothetical protein
VASWDYSQRYPAESDDYIDPDKDEPDRPSFSTSNEDAKGPAEFNWQVTAEGVVELHLTPMVTFGVVFDPKFELANTAVRRKPVMNPELPAADADINCRSTSPLTRISASTDTPRSGARRVLSTASAPRQDTIPLPASRPREFQNTSCHDDRMKY